MKISLSRSSNSIASALPRGLGAALGALAVLLLWPHPAAAQFGPIVAGTLGDMICNSELEMSPFANLFSVVAYCAGAAFIGQGLHMMVRYYDNPQSMRLSEPLGRIFGGAALLAAPSVAETIIETLFGFDAGGGLNICASGAVTNTDAGTIGLDTLLTNLVGNIAVPMNMLVSMAAFVIGFFMVVRGLLKASKYGTDPRENSMTRILSNLIVGSILMVVAQDFNTLLTSLFGAPEQIADVAGWQFVQQLGASQQFINAVTDAGYFFEMVGMIAFVRGWMIIRSAAEGSGQATMAQGITHMLGGALAMNIFGFLQIMDQTFGTNFLLPA